jgi:hypothetical protein
VNEAGAVPASELQLELEIARRVGDATNNFDSAEIARLRSLVEGADIAVTEPASPSMLSSGMAP